MTKSSAIDCTGTIMEVASESDPDVTYTVNTGTMTCDCPAWRNGLTRPCKHLKKVLHTMTAGDILTHEVAQGIMNAPLLPHAKGMRHTVFTVGHSSHRLEDVLVTLVEHGIKRLVDVRSTPYSKYRPQFNKESLAVACEKVGIRYHWYGRVLGGRSKIECGNPEFGRGMKVIRDMAANGDTPVMMCSEADPAKCHRAYKLAAYLHRHDPMPPIKHIVKDGLIDSAELEDSLPISWLTHEYGGEH